MNGMFTNKNKYISEQNEVKFVVAFCYADDVTLLGPTAGPHWYGIDCNARHERENNIVLDDQDLTSTELTFMIDFLCTS